VSSFNTSQPLAKVVQLIRENYLYNTPSFVYLNIYIFLTLLYTLLGTKFLVYLTFSTFIKAVDAR